MIHWQDERGRQVPLDEPVVTSYLRGATAMAETEFPAPKGTNADGWTEVSDTYRAPSKATQAIVELHLQWAPNSEVRWSQRVVRGVGGPEAPARSGWPRSISGPRAARRRWTTAACTSR